MWCVNYLENILSTPCDLTVARGSLDTVNAWNPSARLLVCAFWGSPLVTVTVRDGVEFLVEEAILGRQTSYGVLAVVVLTAAPICAPKKA